jgi:cysteine desulfurase
MLSWKLDGLYVIFLTYISQLLTDCVLRMTNQTPAPVYLDYAASTPVHPAVIDVVVHYMGVAFGNAGSRTHRYGNEAAKAVRQAREQIARVVETDWDSVLFTSGATESNNLALRGLADEATKDGKRHVISTAIEHKSVLEPLEQLQNAGFEITLLSPDSSGAISAEAVSAALRSDTWLVSIMHANNETGVIQPVEDICSVLTDHPAAFHIDAAQTFGRLIAPLRHPRIDLISASGHKIYSPKGIGALIVRNLERTNGLRPLMVGGGQERKLRPGTLPVSQCAGFGKAAELALLEEEGHRKSCLSFKSRLLDELSPLGITINGDPDKSLPNIINLSIANIDSEALMIALRDLVAISNGAACTSTSYEASHVLRAMGLSDDAASCATRWSWSHDTPDPDWAEIRRAIGRLC